MSPRKRIALVSTGGTIEKTYDEMSGLLSNSVSNLDVMLARLDLPHLDIERIALMHKDSLDMTSEDHAWIATTATHLAEQYDGVVVVHGTDRLAVSGEMTLAAQPVAPVVFTGAMRPYELRTSDAMQNLVESLCAVQLLPPGVYAALHGRVLTFPGVQKDYARGTFVAASDTEDPDAGNPEA